MIRATIWFYDNEDDKELDQEWDKIEFTTDSRKTLEQDARSLFPPVEAKIIDQAIDNIEFAFVDGSFATVWGEF